MRVQILGVNESGREGGNAGMCNQRDIPWLQESSSHSVWNSWQVTYRDVIVLNADNEPIEIYNLTQNSLSNPSNYDTLKELLRQAAQATVSP